MTEPNPPPLSAALKNPDWRVRLDSVQKLESSRDARAVLLLIEAMHDEDAWVASSAVHALVIVARGTDSLPAILLPLLRALDGPHSKMRRAAAESLEGHFAAHPTVAARLRTFRARHGTSPDPLMFRHAAADGTILSEEPVFDDDDEVSVDHDPGFTAADEVAAEPPRPNPRSAGDRQGGR